VRRQQWDCITVGGDHSGDGIGSLKFGVTRGQDIPANCQVRRNEPGGGGAHPQPLQNHALLELSDAAQDAQHYPSHWRIFAIEYQILFAELDGHGPRLLNIILARLKRLGRVQSIRRQSLAAMI
jgi:hypothetical protein